MKYKYFILTLIFIFAAAGGIAASVNSDEFVGPFPSWSNVKTNYGAKGDGVTDDTAVLQRALDELGKNGKSNNLYIPAGTYRITSTLKLSAVTQGERGYFSIIGEDPTRTTLKWDGGASGTLFNVEGINHSRFSRLTFDGSNKSIILVDQSRAPGQGSFDTGNEYADNIYKDADMGIMGGTKGGGFAETTIIRSRFVNLKSAGIFIGNFNALDIWVRYNVFENNGTGVANRLANKAGAGTFRLYNNIFRNSIAADVSTTNTGVFSMRNNYSIGSWRFIDAGETNNPANYTLQGNTILDTVDPVSISIRNQGPTVMYDNIIRARSSVTNGPVVIAPDLTALGNTFAVSNPINISGGRLTDVDSVIVNRSAVNPSEPVLPPFEQNLNRRVFEVAKGATTAVIQQAINQAAALNGARPIVHLPEGTYQITSTLVIPANTDLQLVGDGYFTRLVWSGTGTGPVVKLQGPSQATVRELHIDGSYKVDGLAADNIDQPGSRVFLLGTKMNSGASANFFYDRLDHTVVEAYDINHGYQEARYFGFGAVGFRIVGGPQAAAGNPQGGRVNIFSGSSACQANPYNISEGGKLLARDLWYECPTPVFLRTVGRANVTVESHRVGDDAFTHAGIDIQNLNGRVSVIGTMFDNRIEVSGNNTNGQVLVAGMETDYTYILAQHGTYFRNNASPPGAAALLNSRQWRQDGEPGNGASNPTANIGTADAAFIRTMFAHTRGEIARPPTSLPAGITDIRLFRVWATQGINNIHLVGGGGTTVIPPGDTISPTVSLTAPSAGSSITSGSSVTVSANASDNVGVVGVQFKLDGNNLGAEDTSAPYGIDWNTTGVSAGTHTLSAVARDAAGNISNATNVTVMINAVQTTAGMSGPLRKSSNPHWFTDNSGKAILLAGNDVHGMYQAMHENVDYAAHLNNLSSWGGNNQRLRMYQLGWYKLLPSAEIRQLEPKMYLRSSTSGALDGGNKFDLTKWNESFFTGLRQRVIDAQNKGIYTTVVLYMPQNVSPASWFYAWIGNPWNASNNINGVNGDQGGDGSAYELYGPYGLSSGLWPYHQAYLKKVVDSLNDLDGVIYEVGNELRINSKDFQYAVINYIKNYEKTLPKQHPVGMTAHGDWCCGAYNGPYSDLLNNPGEWLAPGEPPQGWEAFQHNPPVETAKIVMNHGDHIWGWTVPPLDWIWKSFIRGGNPLLTDTYSQVFSERQGKEAVMTALRNHLGQVNSYARQMNLLAMRPRGDLTSTTYALANPGQEYLVFQPASGGFTVNLSSGTYSAEWFNPANGQKTSASSVSGEGSRTFTPPFSGLAVLYLKLAGTTSPDTTAPTVSLTAPASGSTITAGTSVTVSANASDNVGVVGVQFKLDGNNLGTEDTSAPYSIDWNTTGVSAGSHTITAVARDAAGNIATSASVTVTVSPGRSYKLGDINNDSQITAFDAALAAQASVGLITLTSDQTKAADVNGSQDVTAFDAALIAQYAVGLITKFPVE